MLDALISGASSLIGGLLGRSGAQRQNEIAQQTADRNIALQREFAQNGIRWKVDDAKAAGIHPLYALGASTSSFAPVSVGSVNENAPLADMSRNLGQDLSRAVNATRTAPERVAAAKLTALQLEGAQLDNDLKRTRLASSLQLIKQQNNPPLPAVGPFKVPEAGKADERPPLMLDGNRIMTDPNTSPGKAFEDWLGDDILSPGFIPNLWGWAKTTYGSPTTWPGQLTGAAVRAAIEDMQREKRNMGDFYKRNLGRYFNRDHALPVRPTYRGSPYR